MHLSRGICISCMTYQGVRWLISYSGQLFGQGRRMTYRDKKAHTGIMSACYVIHCVSSTDASEDEIWKVIIKPVHRKIAKCHHKQYLSYTYYLLALRLILSLFLHGTTAVAQWLRCCATNRKVVGSIPAGVIGIFHWHKILPIALWSLGRLSL